MLTQGLCTYWPVGESQRVSHARRQGRVAYRSGEIRFEGRRKEKREGGRPNLTKKREVCPSVAESAPAKAAPVEASEPSERAAERKLVCLSRVKNEQTQAGGLIAVIITDVALNEEDVTLVINSLHKFIPATRQPLR